MLIQCYAAKCHPCISSVKRFFPSRWQHSTCLDLVTKWVPCWAYWGLSRFYLLALTSWSWVTFTSYSAACFASKKYCSFFCFSDKWLWSFILKYRVLGKSICYNIAKEAYASSLQGIAIYNCVCWCDVYLIQCISCTTCIKFFPVLLCIMITYSIWDFFWGILHESLFSYLKNLSVQFQSQLRFENESNILLSDQAKRVCVQKIMDYIYSDLCTFILCVHSDKQIDR